MNIQRGRIPFGYALTGLGAALVIWLTRRALAPFFVAMVLAYLMAPAVRVLARRMKRGIAVLLVLCASFVALGLALWALVPFLSSQIERLVASGPHWKQVFIARFGPWTQAHPWVEQRFRQAIEGVDPMVIFHGLKGAGEGLLGFLLQVMTLMLVPIIVYYLLLDGPEMVQWLERWIPPRHRPRVKAVVGQIHERLGGYIRGEIAVAVVMALLHGLALQLLGVPYAWILGLVAGVSNVVPYSPYLTALAPALIMTGLDGGSASRLLAVGIVFVAVQKIEALYLTPVWVGRASKLHPLEVLLGILCFGFAFGLLGLIFAVPLMIVVKVLGDVFLADYERHPWFTREAGQSDSSSN